jgi:putative heme-binding domain-containing protein
MEARAVDARGQPQWIWCEASPLPAQSVVFSKAFEASAGAKAARLSVLADFCEVRISLNGRLVANLEDYQPPLHCDIKPWLADGKNVLSIEATSTRGPSAIAVSLELADAESRTIVSDGSWRAAVEVSRDVSRASRPVKTLGTVAWKRWTDALRDTAIDSFDDYTQWEQAKGRSDADPARFLVPPGFEIELVRAAQEGEGSWIALEFDDRGRLLIGREDRGIWRMTLPTDERTGEPQLELVDDTLEEIRGLVWHEGELFASASVSLGLYRLRDTSGDGKFDSVTELQKWPGGAGHGRNDLALGKDGKLYGIFGDAVNLPKDAADLTSPAAEHYREPTKEGHVVRVDLDGGNPTIFAAGLRNPFGIAFHPEHGAAFTYDADAEYDMGSPWYRPTRIVHLMSGADYGWRGVTKSWPPYIPDRADAAPPLLDIGKGSPTSVKFGAGSKFPRRWREALFALDWTYGRILAIHLTPRGSSYAARADVFAKGRPINVTDLAIGPDGAMYVVTGGRKTQSGVFRIRYTKPLDGENATPGEHEAASEKFAAEMRKLRHRLESFHGNKNKNVKAVNAAWPYLGDSDPWLRHAARIAIEHQPFASWRKRALAETQPLTSVTAVLALARSEEPANQAAVLARLNALPLKDASDTQKLAALQACKLCLDQAKALDPKLRAATTRRLEALYPDERWEVNRSLSLLVARLGSPKLVPETLALLRTAAEQHERMHYLFVIRDAKSGWTPELRQTYFEYLTQMQEFRGGEGMPTFVQRIEQDALAALDDDLRPKFQKQLRDSRESETAPPVEPRPLVKEWSLDQLEGDFAAVGKQRDFERGAAMFAAAQCSRCHRMGPRGGVLGPDLTSIASRFSRRDMLLSIVEPSRVVDDAYRRVQVVTAAGRVVAGQVIPSQDYRSATLTIATEDNERIEIPKSDVESYTVSPISVMPEKLLNTLSRDEILDLLAFLEAGGNRQHPIYQLPPSE